MDGYFALYWLKKSVVVLDLVIYILMNIHLLFMARKKHYCMVGSNHPVELFETKNGKVRIQFLIPEFINITNFKIKEL